MSTLVNYKVDEVIYRLKFVQYFLISYFIILYILYNVVIRFTMMYMYRIFASAESGYKLTSASAELQREKLQMRMFEKIYINQVK